MGIKKNLTEYGCDNCHRGKTVDDERLPKGWSRVTLEAHNVKSTMWYCENCPPQIIFNN